MRLNLEYSIYPYGGDVNEMETQLIRNNEPPLNLTKWSNPQKKKFQNLRDICKEEARQVWLKYR